MDEKMNISLISDRSLKNIKKEMKLCHVSASGIKLMAEKSQFHIIKIRHFDNRGLNILKQESLSIGAETAVSQEVGNFTKDYSDALLFATLAQIKTLIKKLQTQPFQLKKLATQLSDLINNNSIIYQIGNKKFDFTNKAYVMGILNVTPDSFYDGNQYLSKIAFQKRLEQMIKDKVDIIDIGAESTRPGAEKISPEEELKRLLPLLKLARKLTTLPISIDTYKSQVAQVTLDNGADMINDISGLHFDKKMASVVGKAKASLVVMHIKGTPKIMQHNPKYKNLMLEILDYLQESLNIAKQSNISQVLIDPGIGFGKTVAHNYEIIDKLPELKILKKPILMGLSRKSLIGKLLNLPPEKRLSPTMALNLVALLNGASVIRVHDIKEGRQTIKLAQELKKNRGNV